jgi:XTP/dITP diphosphohydrolase
VKKKFLLASNNKKKLAELIAIAGEKYEVLSLAQAGVESDPEESGKTFAENSYIKAFSAMQAAGMPAIADDSGLEVYSLNGEPGVYSARYAAINGRGEESDDSANNALLVERLDGVSDRRAAFVSCITLIYPDGRKLVAEGRCEGEILESPRGENGFGYDPLFYIPELGKTMAELSASEKNAISHRGRALKILFEKLGEDE